MYTGARDVWLYGALSQLATRWIMSEFVSAQ